MTISEYALKFLGHPYIWGGDGSGRCFGGFDCSGLAVECLRAFGVVNCDLTAQGLYDYLTYVCKKIDFLDWESSDILFFGKSLREITHVAIAIGDGLMVEAGGGGAKCKTLETSTGMVRIRPISSRKDFLAALRSSDV